MKVVVTAKRLRVELRGPIVFLALPRILLLLLVNLILTSELQAQTAMQITAIPPDDATRFVAGDWWRVYLDGQIDDDAVQRLAIELTRGRVERGTAFLDSPGGSLKGGIEIGRLLRKHGLMTYVRKRVADKQVPGKCFSACVLAFVGGYFRYLGKEDRIGVHRFSTLAAATEDLDLAQVVSGSITAYLTEMGVDVKLFELMTRIGSDDMYVLSQEQARDLRVANNGFQPSTWSIEAGESGLFLLGVQDAWYGLGKAMFFCREGTLIFYPFYQAGPNSEVIAMTAVRHSLRLDDEYVSLAKPIVPLVATNGYVSTAFVLPDSLAERISASKSVGYAAHPPNPDLFYGFTVEIADQQQKIAGYIRQCLSQ